MNPQIKAELVEILQTFAGVMVPIILLNLQQLNISNFSTASFQVFLVSCFVQAFKATWNKFFPNVQLAKAQYLASKHD